MEEVLPRIGTRRLSAAMRAVPVVVVTGSRQTGKTTLVRSVPGLQDHLYLTLDDLDVREQALERPGELVARAPRVILDEVQRAPDLLLAVKRAVDGDHPRRLGRFVLTGSANLLLATRISETLAGRAVHVTLWPMTRRELLGLGQASAWEALLTTPATDWRDRFLAETAPRDDWRAVVRRGGYPTPAHELRDPESARLWLDGYVRTYLERDLQDLAAIANLVDFRRLMRATCLRVGNLLNQAELARDVGLSPATAHRYLNLLEASYQLVRLPPYLAKWSGTRGNRTKRLVKTPMAYWTDTALALFLSGAEPAGAHLENYVLNDLLAWRDARTTPAEVLFWRTHAGDEVDFVIEHEDALIAVEVKTGSRPREKDLRGLRAFREEYGGRVKGALLLHDGDEVSWLADGVLGLPWWRVI